MVSLFFHNGAQKLDLLKKYQKKIGLEYRSSKCWQKLYYVHSNKRMSLLPVYFFFTIKLPVFNFLMQFLQKMMQFFTFLNFLPIFKANLSIQHACIRVALFQLSYTASTYIHL